MAVEGRAWGMMYNLCSVSPWKVCSEDLRHGGCGLVSLGRFLFFLAVPEALRFLFRLHLRAAGSAPPPSAEQRSFDDPGFSPI